MVTLIVIKHTTILSKYKAVIKKLGISHQEVADYTGHTRENINLLLNGRSTPPKVALHLSEEIEELIKKSEQST